MSGDKQENKPKVDLGLLEEDDEFEEFPAEGNLNWGFPLTIGLSFYHLTQCANLKRPKFPILLSHIGFIV